MFDYDAELVRYTVRLRAAADIQADDRVLDIGCGAGQTTRQAGAAAHAGSALGIDVSSAMIDRARRLTAREGIRNVSFELADVQTHRFASEGFTAAISRFGTMFFADPVAAFANVGSALQAGGRLAQIVWQSADQQEWVTAIRQALAGDPMPGALTGGAFSLAEPSVITRVLTAAGFRSIEITDAPEPVYYGPDAAAARDALNELGMVEYLVADLGPTATARAHDRLLSLLESHDSGNGVWFDSRAWLVTAQRR